MTGPPLFPGQPNASITNAPRSNIGLESNWKRASRVEYATIPARANGSRAPTADPSLGNPSNRTGSGTVGSSRS